MQVNPAIVHNYVMQADQGPQAVGIGLASLTYAAMAALPYWLPALAAGKKRKRRHAETIKKTIPISKYPA